MNTTDTTTELEALEKLEADEWRKPEPHERRLLYRIPDTNQTEDDRAFYQAIMQAMFAEKQAGELPAYEFPDWLKFPAAGGLITITTRFFPVENGIGFIIGNDVFTLTLLPAKKARAIEVQALQDVHEFLNRRNTEDKVKFPSAEFDFSDENKQRLQAEESFRFKIKQVEALQYELKIANTEGISIEDLIPSVTLTKIANDLNLALSTVSEHADNMRGLGLLDTAPRKRLPKYKADQLVRRILSGRQEGRNKPNQPEVNRSQPL